MILDITEILDNIYICVFSINSESVLLLASVKYMLCSHFTKNCIFCTFWRLKTLVLWRENVQKSSFIFAFILSKKPQNWFHETFITQEWLVVESCLTPWWITYLMLYPLLIYPSFQLTNLGLKCLCEALYKIYMISMKYNAII